MDLKSLLIDKSRVGGRGSETTKTKSVSELRQGLYKKTGNKTSSESRTLRSIQVWSLEFSFIILYFCFLKVNQKRNEKRTVKQNVGRKIASEDVGVNDENRNVNVGAGAGQQRLSRKDRLAEYLREKKQAQDQRKKKSVQPFR